MVGKVTIGNKEYRIHFGMLVFERFMALFAENKVTAMQTTTCVIYHGHENWCELNDEPLDLKRKDVYAFVENSHANSDEPALLEIQEVMTKFFESKNVDDVIKAGKDTEKKDAEKKSTNHLTQQPQGGLHSENLDSSQVITTPAVSETST